MSSKNFHNSFIEVFHKKKDKAKLLLNKFKRQRNLSTSNTFSTKQLFSKKEQEKGSQDKKTIENSTLLYRSQKNLEEISSYGTNKKLKLDKDKDKEKEIPKNKIKIVSLSCEKEPKEAKDEEKYIRVRTKNKSNSLSKIPTKNMNKNKEKEKNEEKKEIIVRKCSDFSDIPEHFLILPSELSAKLEKPELYIISPSKNIEGNYSSYINGVAETLKEFIEIDYDSIFDHENKDNVNYCYYTAASMDLEEKPKKKLLLIDLDETLVHSEFRNKNNYKELDLFTKNSKCHSRTFSYSDENYIYYMDVFFRPHLKNFLSEVSKYFDLAIFTAAMKGYADTILDFIDPQNKYFQFRLYRDACIPIQQRLYIKDLRIIKDYDPMNVILMDNSLYSFMNQPSNGMLVNSFYTSHKDTQLISAKNFLINHIFPCDDIRKECEKWYHFSKLFYKGTSKEIKENEKL